MLRQREIVGKLPEHGWENDRVDSVSAPSALHNNTKYSGKSSFLCINLKKTQKNSPLCARAIFCIFMHKKRIFRIQVLILFIL